MTRLNENGTWANGKENNAKNGKQVEANVSRNYTFAHRLIRTEYCMNAFNSADMRTFIPA